MFCESAMEAVLWSQETELIPNQGRKLQAWCHG